MLECAGVIAEGITIETDKVGRRSRSEERLNVKENEVFQNNPVRSDAKSEVCNSGVLNPSEVGCEGEKEQKLAPIRARGRCCPAGGD